jgi:hypothetical protein
VQRSVLLCHGRNPSVGRRRNLGLLVSCNSLMLTMVLLYRLLGRGLPRPYPSRIHRWTSGRGKPRPYKTGACHSAGTLYPRASAYSVKAASKPSHSSSVSRR